MHEEVKITGWDFSPLTETGRMTDSPLPWDYGKAVKKYLTSANTMLDMGTGGGEFLMTLAPLPEHTFATEGYEPNKKIASDNLKPLGIKVISDYKDSALPFEDNYFDVVINRHEYFEAAELFRIIKPGGFFITQQVKGNCDDSIIRLFNPGFVSEYKDWSLEKALRLLSSAGFIITDKQEENGFSEFKDTGALISYIKALNWIVRDFSGEKYVGAINNVRDIIAEKGSFKSTLDRFLIICSKPV